MGSHSIPYTLEAHEATHVAGGVDDIDSALAIAAMANLTNTKIWQGNAGNRPVEVAMPAAGPNFVSGSYAGNDAFGRQITTGFACKLVIILELGISAVHQWIVLNATGEDCLAIYDTDSVDDTPQPYLHATNGFVLGSGVMSANNTGDNYKYVAFG